MSRRFLLVVLIALWGSSAVTAQPTRSPGGKPAEPKRSLDGRVAVYPSHLAGRTMASGARYEPAAFVAAHATLPLGTRLLVSDGSRRVTVTVLDRGPYDGTSILLVSQAAARELGLREAPEFMRIAIAPPGSVAVDERPGIAMREAGDAADSDNDTGTTSGGSVSFWSVQLGSFSDERGARRMAERIEGARAERMQENGRDVWKVYFGQFDDRGSATAWRDRLRGWGYDGFVREVGAR